MADNISKALLVYEKLPKKNQLELMLSLHNSTPTAFRDQWLNDSLASASEEFKIQVANYMLSTIPVKEYAAVTKTFIGANDNPSKQLVQIYQVSCSVEDAAANNNPSADLVLNQDSTSGYGKIVSPSNKKHKLTTGFSFTDMLSDDDGDDQKVPAKDTYGTSPVTTEADTEKEFKTDDASFIVRVSEKDKKPGFNMGFVLLSLLNYTEKDYDKDSLGFETDASVITVQTLTKLLDKFKVRNEEINDSEEDILTGNKYHGKLILLAYCVKKYARVETDFPEKWIHFCLFFQENNMLLTFNTENINYKIGKIGLLKKNVGDFNKYATNILHKKIVPVVRNDSRKYEVTRKMSFRSAYIISKN